MPDLAMLAELVDVNPRDETAPLGAPVSFVSMDDVTESGELQRVKVKPARSGFVWFREGDVLIAKITPCLENGKGAHARGLPTALGQGSTEFHVLRPRCGASDRFIYHWTKSPHLRRAAEAMMTGSAGQRRVPAEFFGRFEIPMFATDEQRRIAEILDTIDVCIRATLRLVAKLAMVKDGLARELIRGGRQGSDWRIVRISDVAAVGGGATPDRSRQDYWAGGSVPWVKTAEVNGRRIFTTEEHVTETAVEECSLRLLPAGAVLVAMYGQGRTRGRSAILGNPATTNQACAAIEPGPELRSEFLFEVLQLEYERLRAAGHGSNQLNLSAEIVGDFAFAMPPPNEQDRLVEIIGAARRRIEAEEATARKYQGIRQGLAHDLLSGRVRTVAP
ncbi:MAG: restriction endonuclease subunit S [Actinobacteria bacterium]|nr:restriction endonuclease subunit S [Actinomycetota bacterium]